jgi:putative chitinase
MTGPQLLQILPRCPPDKADIYAARLTDAMLAADICTDVRQAAFIGQIALESNELTEWIEDCCHSAARLVELWPHHFTTEQAQDYAYHSERIANRAYANRNGNGDEASGDGWLFRGRGPIQLTGRANYAAFGLALNVPLIVSPDLATDPGVGFRVAARYWIVSQCNEPADAGDFAEVTRRINGGLNDLDKRLAYRNAAMAVFQLSEV